MIKEIWKEIKGYEGMYQISSFGNVKSLKRKFRRKERMLKCYLDNRDYVSVTLSKGDNGKIKRIHVLAAIAFLNHAPNGHKLVIDHKDHNKLNNVLENLQIITNRENCSKDQFRHNRSSKYIGVHWKGRSKKWTACIKINGRDKYLGYFIDEHEAYLAYQKALKSIN